MLSWFVAKTKPRREVTAAVLLSERGLSTYLPMFAPRRNRPRDLEPLFPGYLFVRLDIDAPSDWLEVRSAFGISYFLGGQGVGDRSLPTALPDDLVDEIRRRVARQLSVREDVGFAEGERVAVVGGAFDGLEAIFSNRSGACRSRVLVNLVGRQVSVSIESERLSRLAPAV